MNGPAQLDHPRMHARRFTLDRFSREHVSPPRFSQKRKKGDRALFP
jgi:hypothetical protein